MLRRCARPQINGPQLNCFPCMTSSQTASRVSAMSNTDLLGRATQRDSEKRLKGYEKETLSARR